MIGNRLKHLERQVRGRPCAACAAAPRCLTIRSEYDREIFDRQMRERKARCTCGRRFYVKVITLVRAVAA
jgi:hypothetical protein